MIRSLLSGLLLILMSIGAGHAQPVVTPRTILEIQPFVDGLDYLFTPASVQVLLDNGYTYAGRFRNDLPPVASGVYFYKLIAGSFTDTKKLTLLK